MKSGWSCLSLSITLVVLCAWASVAHAEHGNTWDTATAITVDGPAVDGEITPAADPDWFSIVAVAGTTYYVDIVVDTLDWYHVTLFEPDGSTDITSPDVSFLWTCPTSGTYYFEVRGWDDEATGTYSVTVWSFIDDHGDSSGEATAITPDADAESGSIEAPGEIDYFSFAAVADTSYDVQVVLDTLPGVLAYFYGVDGTTELTIGRTQTLWTFPTTGTYYIKIAGHSSTAYGTYELSIATYADDYGNWVDTATPITPDGPTVSGEIEIADDQDCFSFAAVEGKSYGVLTLADTTETISTSVRNAAGGRLEFGGCTLAWSGPVGGAGTYYLCVTKSTVDTYTIAMTAFTDDHGNSKEDATPVDINTAPIPGAIEVANEGDWFSFDAVEGGVYSVTAAGITMSNVYFSFWASNGVTRILTGFNGFVWTCPEGGTGTYYVVLGWNECGSFYGTYEFSVGENTPDDHGNSWDLATPLTVGDDPLASEIELPGDQDWFKFDAAAGVEYAIVAEVGTMSHSKIDLFDTDGATAIDDNTHGLTWTCPPDGTGTYYVRITDLSSRAGTYSIWVESFDDDHGNSATGATRLTVGAAPLSGETEVVGDEDWFVFTAVEKALYFIDADASLPNLFWMGLFDRDGLTEIDYDTYEAEITWTCPDGMGGDYYVAVRNPDVSSYEISVSTFCSPACDAAACYVCNSPECESKCGEDERCDGAGGCESAFVDIGQGCVSDDDCEGDDFFCASEIRLGLPGGTCTVECETDGDCGEGNTCGLGTGSKSYCTDSCETMSCRSGYSCRDDACFPDCETNDQCETTEYCQLAGTPDVDQLCLCPVGTYADIEAGDCLAHTCLADPIAVGDSLSDVDRCDGSTDRYEVGRGYDTCTGARSPGDEVLYELTVPASAEYAVTVRPSDDFNLVLWVTSDCMDVDGADCLAGSDVGGVGEREDLVIANNGDEAVDYYIVVDSKSAVACAGTFDIAVNELAVADADADAGGYGDMDADVDDDGDAAFDASDDDPAVNPDLGDDNDVGGDLGVDRGDDGSGDRGANVDGGTDATGHVDGGSDTAGAGDTIAGGGGKDEEADCGCVSAPGVGVPWYVFALAAIISARRRRRPRRP